MGEGSGRAADVASAADLGALVAAAVGATLANRGYLGHISAVIVSAISTGDTEWDETLSMLEAGAQRRSYVEHLSGCIEALAPLEPAMARTHLTRARKLADEDNSMAWQSSALPMIGAAAAVGDLSCALEVADRWDPYFRSGPLIRAAGAAATPDLARTLLSRAAAIQDSVEAAPERRTDALTELAEAYVALGDDRQAWSALVAAGVAAGGLRPRSNLRSRALERLGVLHARLGDLETAALLGGQVHEAKDAARYFATVAELVAATRSDRARRLLDAAYAMSSTPTAQMANRLVELGELAVTLGDQATAERLCGLLDHHPSAQAALLRRLVAGAVDADPDRAERLLRRLWSAHPALTRSVPDFGQAADLAELCLRVGRRSRDPNWENRARDLVATLVHDAEADPDPLERPRHLAQVLPVAHLLDPAATATLLDRGAEHARSGRNRSPYRTAYGLLDLAAVARRVGLMDRAADWLAEAEACARQGTDPLLVEVALAQVAEAAAAVDHRRAWRIASELEPGSRRSLVRLLYPAARRAEPGWAAAIFDAEVAFARHLPDRERGYELMALATSAAAAGDPAGARALFDEALPVMRNAPDPMTRSAQSRHVHDTALKLGLVAEAAAVADHVDPPDLALSIARASTLAEADPARVYLSSRTQLFHH